MLSAIESADAVSTRSSALSAASVAKLRTNRNRPTPDRPRSAVAPTRTSRLIQVPGRCTINLRHIAHATNGFDSKRRLHEPSSNARDVELECVWIDCILVSEELIHEPFLGHHLAQARYQ